MIKISKDIPPFRAEFRRKRDALLLASDSYMLPDRGLSEDEVAELILYRQALRDAPRDDLKATEWVIPPAPLWLRNVIPFSLDWI